MKIVRQELKQAARDRWSYELTRGDGRVYLVAYEVQPLGYVKEVITLGGQHILEREWKIGMDSVPSVWEFVENHSA